MCGITGIVSFKTEAQQYATQLNCATLALQKRGPDADGVFFHKQIGLGHRRLSIIDTSKAANQPFTDNTDRYTIVFNGEFFNYKQYRESFTKQGIEFRTHSDTEVLLHLYLTEGPNFINKVNGFFALAIYDNNEESLFIARDRYGVKPLLYFKDDEKLVFASEMKALMAFDIPRNINTSSLYTYLQLNYLPNGQSMLQGVKKLNPGCYLFVKNNTISHKQYYSIPQYQDHPSSISFDDACKTTYKLLDESVRLRMISDVPLGSFLSGGLDSSIISALAAKHTKKLKTFSIGFKDEPYYDETSYAKQVALHIGSEHTAFSLTNHDLYNHLHDILNYIDEPFADSSAIPLYILSQYTRKEATVALSGDGADELLGGYNKHKAKYWLLTNPIKAKVLPFLVPVLNQLPHGRHNKTLNKLRQLHRLAHGASLSAQERYWQWCCWTSPFEALRLLNIKINEEQYLSEKQHILDYVNSNDINSLLNADLHIVLEGDMLRKVDLMSMANSLEIRNPFLDYNFVNFCTSLPEQYKIDNNGGKLVLRKAFAHLLPEEIITRKKKGFEVPLMGWFKNELYREIVNVWLNDDFIVHQGIFNLKAIQNLKITLKQNKSGDIQARLWALIVFQHWYKRVMSGEL